MDQDPIQERIRLFLQKELPQCSWQFLPWDKVTSLGAGSGLLPVLALETPSQAVDAIRKIIAAGKKAVPLGGGFNFAGMDEMREDLIFLRLAPGKEGGGLRYEGNGIFRAGGGVPLKKLIIFALEHGFGGASSLAGIPGTVGGALAMNAGARGGEISQFLLTAEILPLTGEDISFQSWTADELEFSYRSSPHIRDKALLWEALFSFAPVDKEKETLLLQEELKKREKNPKGRSAGSVFANPPGTSAGKLLEEAGCKGMEEGAFFVSPLHANWILRKPGTPPLDGHFRDFANLVKRMQKLVKDKFNIDLTPEIRMPGKKE